MRSLRSPLSLVLMIGAVALGLAGEPSGSAAQPVPSLSAVSRGPVLFREGTEAHRVLGQERAEIARRFGSGVEIEVQTVRRGTGGSAYLLHVPRAGSRPALFGTDGAGQVIWRHYDPIGDTLGYHYHPRIAANAEGQVLLAYSNTDPQGVHARLFDRDGKAEWTSKVSRKGVDHLTLSHWPGQGWVIGYSRLAAADPTPAAALQLLDQDGRARWGEPGLRLAVASRGHTPVSLIQDSPQSVLAVWYQWSREPERPSAFVCQRVSAGGEYLWKSPARLGDGPRPGFAPPREIGLHPAPGGGVYADLYRGERNDVRNDIVEYRVLISPDARVTVEPRKS